MKGSMNVIKMSGTLEPFSEEKVRRSIERAGIPEKIRDQVLKHIENVTYDRITTKELYKHIVEFLDKSSHPQKSSRYQLKKAIMDLGPTGYPFEKFISSILEHYGYGVETGVVVSGKCVNHEVDVVAQKDDEHFMVECKFHNKQGIRSDVKVALYVKARFDDVKAAWEKKKGHQAMFHQAWLITNTKLSLDAIAFGECAGMRLIAWSYPLKGSLQDLIEDIGLHPITCLSSVSAGEKLKLLERDIVLCRDMLKADKKTLNFAGIDSRREGKIKEQIKILCNT